MILKRKLSADLAFKAIASNADIQQKTLKNAKFVFAHVLLYLI